MIWVKHASYFRSFFCRFGLLRLGPRFDSRAVRNICMTNIYFSSQFGCDLWWSIIHIDHFFLNMCVHGTRDTGFSYCWAMLSVCACGKRHVLLLTLITQLDIIVTVSFMNVSYEVYNVSNFLVIKSLHSSILSYNITIFNY